MSLERHFRSDRRAVVWSHVLLGAVALFAILAARSAPPDFVRIASAQSGISAVSDHDQRPRFDCDGLEWNTPVAVFRAPLPVESARLGPPARLLLRFQPKGFHYNRPPPVS